MVAVGAGIGAGIGVAVVVKHVVLSVGGIVVKFMGSHGTAGGINIAG